jgi:hypothetical protein
MISNTNLLKHNIFSITNLLLFLLIVPKFNLINISNSWQGIRVENLISAVLLLTILFNPKNFKINDNLKFYLFCAIIFISYLVGITNNLHVHVATLFRTFEYIIFVLFFSNFKLDYKKIISFFKILIILNLIICLLQYFNIIGFISSRGYFEPDYDLWRAAGLFSGSWELSFISSVLCFLIYHSEGKKFDIYFFCTLIILYLAGTRGVMISFFLSIIFLYFGKIKINIFYLIVVFLFFYGFFIFTNKYFQFDLLLLSESLLRLIFLNQNIFEDYGSRGVQYYSWAIRMEAWARYADLFNTNIFTNLFGTGYLSIYYEAFIFRILFANGVIGLVILCIFFLRLKLYMIIFLLLASLSLDFIASFKMFIILFIYIEYLKFLEK